MSKASSILKDVRNHKYLDELGKPKQEGYLPGARLTASTLSEKHSIPIHINVSQTETRVIKDGRTRTGTKWYYLSLTGTDNTIESVIPDGWSEPVKVSSGLSREERETIATQAKVALADLMVDLMASTDATRADAIHDAVTSWAARIPGSGWDERLDVREVEDDEDDETEDSDESSEV
jgi:hypothetical protein